MKGLVVRNTGSWFEVRTPEGEIVQCKVKGNFRLKGIRSTSPVVVGDNVEFVRNNEGTAFITHIDDRRNYIVRKATNLSRQSHILAANIDLCLLVVALKQPTTSVVFIDRFLATAEAYRVPVAIIINKVDLLTEQELAEAESLADIYRDIGYEVMLCSVTERIGLDRLPDLLRGKTSLLAGNSGVGKSEMLNWLVPEAKAKTSPVSEVHLSGMHTTTFSTMYDLPDEGQIIDIPGVKGFGTFNFEREEVYHFFREIFRVGEHCRFGNCLHLSEPGCAVREAVDDGRIAASRYNSYLNMLDDQDESKYRQGY